MPVYDYLCQACGPFSAIRPMAEFAAPFLCGDCGAEAPRVLLSAPSVSGLGHGRRAAFQANERSAHAPARASRHPSGCGCCSGSKGSPLRTEPASAAKSFPTQRPWMISH